jgi:hypothetical protein
MHSNVIRGNKIHYEHFAALYKNSYHAPGWEVFLVNKQINFSALRPDWIILNRLEKRAFIVDLTTKYTPKHYKKGQSYVNELMQVLQGNEWNIIYLEDYWLNATLH